MGPRSLTQKPLSAERSAQIQRQERLVTDLERQLAAWKSQGKEVKAKLEEANTELRRLISGEDGEPLPFETGGKDAAKPDAKSRAAGERDDD